MRSLQARQHLAVQGGSLSPEEQLVVQSPINKLKSIFPNTPLNKHTPVDILLTPPFPTQPRTLIFRDLGVIQNDWVAQEFMLAYFAGEGNSPAVGIQARLHLVLLFTYSLLQLKQSVLEKLKDYGVDS